MADRRGAGQARAVGLQRDPEQRRRRSPPASTAPQGVLESQHAAGGLPTFNYNAGQFEDYEAICGATMTETILKERDTCYCLRRPLQAGGRDRVGGPTTSTRATAARSTRPRPPSARTAASTICTPSRSPTRSATSTASTPSAPAPRSPGPWSASQNGVLSEAEIGFPAAVRRRGGHGPAARDDRRPRGHRRRARRTGRAGRGPAGQGPRPPDHRQGRRGAGPHAAGQALARRSSTRSTRSARTTSRPSTTPTIEEGAADLYMERLALLGFTETLPYDSLGRGEGALRAARRSSSTRSWTPPTCASSCGARPGRCSGRRRRSTLVRAVTGWDGLRHRRAAWRSASAGST